MEKDHSVGVVVGRFQVASLHEGHHHLLEYVQKRHHTMLIVLGVAKTPFTATDPLDFASREKMLRSVFPDSIIVPLQDMPGNDTKWSEELDKLIRSLFHNKTIRLYGSRHSFIERYHGAYETHVIDPITKDSGTTQRENIALEVRSSPDFRAGIIHATQNQYTPWYPCVDIAVWKHEKNERLVLLGNKKEEGNLWRFPGGFIDPKDASVEDAAKREIREETGLEVGPLELIGTFFVDDPRYPAGRIISSFFATEYVFGSNFHAGDDLDALRWFPKKELPFGVVVPAHRMLVEYFTIHFMQTSQTQEYEED